MHRLISSSIYWFFIISLFLPCQIIAQVKLIESEAVDPLGGKNTEFGKALLSHNRDQLYYVKSYDLEQKNKNVSQSVWRAKWRGESLFSNQESIPILNSRFNNAVVGVSNDGQHIYLLGTYSNNKLMWPGLSIADNLGDPWSKPEQVKVKKLRIRSQQFDFYVTPQETEMFISMGGSVYGQLDIYMSQKSEDGTWSEAILLEGINTDSTNEISPFYSAEFKTLFLSSDRKGGMGGYDVYMSARGDTWSDWSKPKALDAPVNSEKFDAYFSAYRREGSFFVSNRNDSLGKLYFLEGYDPTIPVELETYKLTSMEEPADPEFDFDKFSIVSEEEIPADAKAFLFDNAHVAMDSSNIESNGDFKFNKMDRNKEYTVGFSENIDGSKMKVYNISDDEKKEIAGTDGSYTVKPLTLLEVEDKPMSYTASSSGEPKKVLEKMEEPADPEFDFDKFNIVSEEEIPADAKAFLFDNAHVAMDSSNIESNGDFKFNKMDRNKEYTVGFSENIDGSKMKVYNISDDEKKEIAGTDGSYTVKPLSR
jgi:hypothetical protein